MLIAVPMGFTGKVMAALVPRGGGCFAAPYVEGVPLLRQMQAFRDFLPCDVPPQEMSQTPALTSCSQCLAFSRSLTSCAHSAVGTLPSPVRMQVGALLTLCRARSSNILRSPSNAASRSFRLCHG